MLLLGGKKPRDYFLEAVHMLQVQYMHGSGSHTFSMPLAMDIVIPFQAISFVADYNLGGPFSSKFSILDALYDYD